MMFASTCTRYNKLLTLAISAVLLLIRPGVQGQEEESNILEGCTDKFEVGQDYFPDKVEVTESLFWDIEYTDSYKVLRNEIAGETYILYQCGTPSPTEEELGGVVPTAFIPVPIDACALSSTVMMPYVELLGLRTRIKALTGSAPSSVSSTCVKQMVADGLVREVTETDNIANLEALATEFGANIVSFIDDFTSYPSPLLNVTISEFRESTNLAIFEWIKFIAVFFNAEAVVNQVYDESVDRYECTGEEAASNVEETGGAKPTVLWARWANFGGIAGWDVAQCPNYYCEFAELCSADIINSRAGTIDFFGTQLFTTEDFVELAKDADHWIYVGPNWEEAVATHGSVLDQFVSVQNEQVFDTEGSGAGAWFEQRIAEFDVVLQDFCDVVGTAGPLHRRTWLRNVFTEDVGSLEIECDDIEAPLETRATPCIFIGLPPIPVCFSSPMMVELEDGRVRSMEDLQVGDVVKSGNGDSSYSRVYGFGHKHDKLETTFVQLHYLSEDDNEQVVLELTPNHMLFLANGKAIPAKDAMVGDEVMVAGKTAASSVTTISKIDTMVRSGAYAPFTETGTIVVNGIVASCYVSFFSNRFLVSGHWLAHASLTPYRLYFQMFGNNEDNYTEEGIAHWVTGPLEFANWLSSQHFLILAILLPPILVLVSLLRCVEVLLAMTTCWGGTTTLVAGAVLLMMTVQPMARRVKK